MRTCLAGKAEEGSGGEVEGMNGGPLGKERKKNPDWGEEVEIDTTAKSLPCFSPLAFSPAGEVT